MSRKLMDLYAALTVARDEIESLEQRRHRVLYNNRPRPELSPDDVLYLEHIEEELKVTEAVKKAAEKAFAECAAAELTCDASEYESAAVDQIETYLVSIGETDGWSGMPLEWYE